MKLRNHSFFQQSILTKVSLIIVLTSTVTLGIVGLWEYKATRKQMEIALNMQAEALAERLALSFVKIVWDYDKKLAEDVIRSEMKEKSVLGILVWEKGDTNALYGGWKSGDDKVVSAGAPLSNGNFVESDHVILRKETPIGTVRVFLTDHYLRESLTAEMRTILIRVALLDFVIVLLLMTLIRKTLIRPLSSLHNAIIRMQEGQLDQKVEIGSKDEIGQIAESFNVMAEQLKEREKALQESEKKFRNIFENSVEGIFQTTPEGLPISVNPSLASILGFDSPTELKNSISDIGKQMYVDPARRDELFRLFEQSDVVSGFEFQSYKKDKSKIWSSVNVRVIRDTEGKIIYLEGFLSDITERKHAEEALRKLNEELEQRILERTAELARAKDAAETANRAKSFFLANMSHELRTPLNAILGYAQIYKSRPLDPEIIKGLNIIHQSGEHLLTLINDILDIAKIESGKIKLHPVPVDFQNFLDNIAGIIQSRAEAKHLTFKVAREMPLPSRVEADETRLRQVLLNLLDNAVKYTQDGHITLCIKPIEAFMQEDYRQSRPCALLRFEVEDTGIGIAPDQLDHIFQPFEQVDDLTDRFEGTGLGLAVSQRLVQLMGSELYVRSEPGRGSTFWFEIALPITEGVVEAAQPPDRVIGYRGPRRKLLVADDISSNRSLLVDMLKPLGFEIIEAEDGRQAVRLANEVRPDLILMDRWMPVMNGLEAVGRIRKVSELEGVPIIAISASVSKEDQVLIRDSGYDAFLPKPIQWPRMAALLEEHLKLVWEYEGQGDLAGEPDDEKEDEVEDITPPPKEELAVLYDLAVMGDMQGILQRLADIKTMGREYIPFADKLRRLAENYESGTIRVLVQAYLERDI